MAEPEVMTTREAARFLKCSRKFLLRAAKAGRVPAGRLGRRGDYRFIRTDLLDWLRGHDRPVGIRGPRGGGTDHDRDQGEQLSLFDGIGTDGQTRGVGASDRIPVTKRGPGHSIPAPERARLQRLLISRIASGGTLTGTAATVGVSIKTVYRWRGDDPDFDAAVKAVQAKGEAS